MRLFKRVGDIISANLNDMVDSFEGPETMLRQAVREMETTLDEASGAAARAIAQETLLAKELAEQEQGAELWQTRAERAVQIVDDSLARRALARKHEHETLARALRDQWSEARGASQALRRQVEAMRAKHSEARRKLATLVARQQAANLSKQSRQVAPDCSAFTNGFADFERLRAKVDRAEAEAEAMTELWGQSVDDLETAFNDRDDQERIEVELTAIKAKLAR